jgi:signal peptidase I
VFAWWHRLSIAKTLWKARHLVDSGAGEERAMLRQATAEATRILAKRETGRYREVSELLGERYLAVSRTSKRLTLIEYVEAFGVALVMALLLKAYVIGAYVIPSGSMIPTLLVGDHILANKFVYRFGEVKRGDIIVFKYPGDERVDYIKRVIGLPGETVEVKGTQVLINGVALDERYARFEPGFDEERHAMAFQQRFAARGAVTVPAGHYFMMGDNRDRSADSRYWGFVRKDKIRGRAMVIYWSRDREKRMATGIRPLDAVINALVADLYDPQTVRAATAGQRLLFILDKLKSILLFPVYVAYQTRWDRFGDGVN